MLGRLQRGLEELYRVETQVQVDDFVIDADTREQMGVARAPREQLLLSERDGELEIGLFVCDRALDNLARRDPSRRLDDGNLGDFLLAIEGVSHFVYVVWRAHAARPVSALELELQAEVDKYVTCLLTTEADGDGSDRLRRRLFEQFELCEDLDDAERDRYRVANANAAAYSASLERRFVRRRRVADMLAELRRFYRLPLDGKLDFIRQAA
jgi:hypothetical protein